MLYPKTSLFLATLIYFFLLLLIVNNHFHQKNYQSNFFSQSLNDLLTIKINQNTLPNTKQLNNTIKKDIAKQNFSKNDAPSQQSANTNLNDNSNNQTERQILHQPLPNIPPELRYDLLNETIIANFTIDENGKPLKISLTSPSKNLKLNSLLLEKLQEWKFTPSNKITSQNVAVNFLVYDNL